MPAPIVHFEIGARDSKRAQEFYTKLFSWTVNADNPMSYGMTYTKDGDVGIDGGIFQSEGPWYGVRLVAQVDDAEAYLKKAKELGGKLTSPVVEIPGMSMKVGFFTDPEGNLFGLYQPLPR